MQMTVIIPYVTVWNVVNEITCLSFMSLDFTVLFYCSIVMPLVLFVL